MLNSQVATITSKRQLTIPAEIFKALDLKKGQKVRVSQIADGLKIEPLLDLIDSLAGSVKVPKKYQGLSTEEIIKMAKKERFSTK